MKKLAQGFTPIESGFTLIELIVGVSLFLSLLGITWINFSSLPSHVTLTSEYQNVLSDIKSQQSLAMTGSSSYGVHFETTSYTLFKGSVYDANDSTNFTVKLDNANLNFTNDLFPNQVIVFQPSSGEITGFSNAQNSVNLSDTLSGASKTLRLNKYGTEF